MSTIMDVDRLRAVWDRRESKMLGDDFAGLEYDSDLVSRDGCYMALFVPDNLKGEARARQIAKAKHEARAQTDVVSFRVLTIPADWVGSDDHTPAPRTTGWIDAARWIVEHHQARRVVPETGELVPEDKKGGVLLDAFSASAMVQVYDALNEANREKLCGMDVRMAHHIVFDLLAKQKP